MIGIAAAYGFTGTLIANELSNAGCTLRLIGRRMDKLRALSEKLNGTPEIQQADVTSPKEVANALEGLDVLINCAGPFTDLGEPVVREAAKRGIHYLDTTGEQSFIRLALETYGPMAHENGSAVIPACAFEYALGDAASGLAAEPFGECDSLTIAYVLKGFGSSRGTKKSVLRVMGSRGFERRNGHAVPIDRKAEEVNIPGAGRKRGYPFPGGEVFMSPLHVSARDITTLMVFPGPSIVVRAVNATLPLVARSPVGYLASKLIDRSQFGPDSEQRKGTEFVILCRAEKEDRAREIVVRGTDPYGLTAKIAAGVSRMLQDGKMENTGGISPSMVSGYKAILDIASSGGASWTVADIP